VVELKEEEEEEGIFLMDSAFAVRQNKGKTENFCAPQCIAIPCVRGGL
jgi:hypothetical protein